MVYTHKRVAVSAIFFFFYFYCPCIPRFRDDVSACLYVYWPLQLGHFNRCWRFVRSNGHLDRRGGDERYTYVAGVVLIFRIHTRTKPGAHSSVRPRPPAGTMREGPAALTGAPRALVQGDIRTRIMWIRCECPRARYCNGFRVYKLLPIRARVTYTCIIYNNILLLLL